MKIIMRKMSHADVIHESFQPYECICVCVTLLSVNVALMTDNLWSTKVIGGSDRKVIVLCWIIADKSFSCTQMRTVLRTFTGSSFSHFSFAAVSLFLLIVVTVTPHYSLLSVLLVHSLSLCTLIISLLSSFLSLLSITSTTLGLPPPLPSYFRWLHLSLSHSLLLLTSRYFEVSLEREPTATLMHTETVQSTGKLADRSYYWWAISKSKINQSLPKKQITKVEN